MPIPNITLRTANFNPVGFQPIGFTPQNPDLSLLERSLNKIEERQLATSQQRGAIAKALADVELNAAEDEWKTNYINNVQEQISNLVQLGDYSGALNRATILAGQAHSDPALRGRIRANIDYEKKRQEVMNRQDLNQVTKDRWLEENPYHYEDKFDGNGNIVGGTKWESEWNPVSRFDMTKLYEEAKTLAAVEAGGGESATFIDEAGNQVADPGKGFYGMAVKRGTKFERLSEEKLRNVFNALFKQHPEAVESMLQDMDDKLWQYGKATDKDRKAFIGSDIMDDKGKLYSPEEYLSRMVNPVLHEMAYDHRWSTIDYGSGFANYLKAKDEARLRAGLDSDNPTTITKAIEIDMSERAGAAGANLKTAMTKLNTIFPTASKSNEYKKAISDGNYKTAADILEKAINPERSPLIKRNAMNYINILRTEGEIYNNLTEGFSNEERQALYYVNAIEQGSDIPNAANNKFSEEYSKHFNSLFGVTQGGTNTGISRGLPNRPASTYITPANKIAIKFRTNEQKQEVLRSLGDNRELVKSGIRIGKIKGEDCLIVDRNTTRLQDVGTAFANSGYRIFGLSNTEIYRLDKDDNIIKYKRPGGRNIESSPLSGRDAIKALSYFSNNNNTLSKARSVVDNAFRKQSVKKLVEPVQLFPFDNHNTVILREMRDKGYISNEDYNNRIKEYKDNNLKEVIGAVQDLNNFKVWGAMSDSPDNQVRLSQDEVREYAAAILQAYDRDKNGGIEIYPGTEPTGKGYGTTIVIRPQAKSGNNSAIEGRILYVDGLLSTKAAESLANSPEALNRREYKINKIANPNVTDIYGNRIIFDDDESNYKRFNAARELDKAYNKLALAKNKGEVFTKDQADKIAETLVVSSGNVIGNVKASIDIVSKKLMDYYNSL